MKMFSNIFSVENVRNTLKRQLVVLTVPMFIEALLIMSLGAVDTFMLSRHSDTAVAAVGLVNQIIMVCFLVFEVINMGTAVLVSQYCGASLEKRLLTVTVVSLGVNLLSGLLLSVALYYGAGPLLRAMDIDPVLLVPGASYLRLVGIFAFLQAMSLTFSAALRATNRAVPPMVVAAIVNVVNIVANYVLIFGHWGAPAMGVDGAAISTVVCRFLSMVILGMVCYRALFKGKGSASCWIERPVRELKNVIKVGLPSAGEEFSYSMSQLVLVYFIARMGAEALATRTYVVNIVLFVYMFCIAVSHAGAIVIGQLIGQNRVQGAFVLGKYVMKVAANVTLALSVITALLGYWIMGLLTENVDIIRTGTIILAIDVLLEYGRAINIYAVNALRAVGDVNFPFYVGVVVMWTVAVGGGYLLGIVAGAGLAGLWLMFVMDENIRAVVFVRRWRGMKWAGKAFVNR